MPKRIQMSRQHPWRAQNPGAVIVARPSKWGNPFAIGVRIPVSWPTGGDDAHGNIEAENNAEAVAYFRDWMNGVVNYEPYPGIIKWQPDLLVLRGRDLACWCPPDQPCHADVLLEIANPS